MSVKEWL